MAYKGNLESVEAIKNSITMYYFMKRDRLLLNWHTPA